MTSDLALLIGERLRSRRHFLGLSQPDLEAVTGLDDEVISRFENGHHTPSATTLMDLATALQVSVAYLLGLEESP